jgi:hypothetical protein
MHYAVALLATTVPTRLTSLDEIRQLFTERRREVVCEQQHPLTCDGTTP